MSCDPSDVIGQFEDYNRKQHTHTHTQRGWGMN